MTKDYVCWVQDVGLGARIGGRGQCASRAFNAALAVLPWVLPPRVVGECRC